MNRFADFVVNRKKGIVVLFIAVAVICIILQMFVGVNYNMVDYLPSEAQSTKAINIMNDEFGGTMPNASVMVSGVSIQEALEYKQGLADISGVSEVLWLDDAVDIKQPLEVADADTVESFYKDGNALFTVTIEKGMEAETSNAIRAYIGEGNYLAGEAPDMADLQQSTGSEVVNALAILLPIIIAILIISTVSWAEPLFFFAAIGISILINMGTNFFLGEVSFLTSSVSPILQLAVSLDYAIFLMHSFADNRRKYGDPNEAMRHAIKASVSTVAASAATTLFGFLALVFMDFGIGMDLGLNLVKGVAFSFLSTMIFLPALTLLTYKLIDKTRHRPLMPRFKNVNRVLSKFAIPVLILVALIVVPSFLGQGQTGFVYGGGNINPNNPNVIGKEEIRDEFGQSTVMALLVPRGDVAKEADLSADLEQMDHVTGVVSYTNQVGTAIPPGYLSDDITEQFYSDNYARIVVYTDTSEEGDLAFATVQAISDKAQTYYGDTVYSLGQSANLYDMKNVIGRDNSIVNMIAILAIFIVLLITFRSATLPFLLLLTIEAGIWINLAIPYFMGETINYMGYLVLSTVQLGATVDYAILLTTYYMKNRKRFCQRDAIRRSLGQTFKSILVSAAILSTAGFTLYATSTSPSISDIGLLLGRGTLFSFAMVVLFLPGVLKVFDKAIGKTTHGANFLYENKDVEQKEKRYIHKEKQNET
jgi:predicted RND superfamily exporter protein